MKVFGKKIISVDCVWEIQDTEKDKIEKMKKHELFQFLNNKGSYSEEGEDWIEFEIDYYE